MTIAITCTCSARLEVDERFAGQTIVCPDCQKSLEVPPAQGDQRRTSGLALTSLMLALVGAFTVLGTLLAVLFGLLALLGIQNNPERLAGKRYALAGIILGAVLTGLSVFAYSSAELFGVDAVLRESQWMGKLSYPDDLEVKRVDLGYQIERPSEQWGVFINQRNEAAPFRESSSDMMLVHPAKSAYLLCLTENVHAGMTFDQCQERGIQIFRQLEITNLTLRRNPYLNVELERGNKKLWNKEENGKLTRHMEMEVHKTFHNQKKTFILRVIKREDDLQFGTSKMYVVAAGAPAARFPSLKEELRKAVESFQILDW